MKKKALKIILLSFAAIMLGIYQNCGDPHPFTARVDLPSETTIKKYYTINIRLTEANAYSASDEIRVSGTCEGLEETNAEISWEITCSNCNTKKITETQADGCINGELNLSKTLPWSVELNHKYKVKATLIPNNIPSEEISGSSTTWDSLSVGIDRDSSLKPIIVGNLKRSDRPQIGSRYVIPVNAETSRGRTLTYQWFKGEHSIVDNDTITGQGTNELIIDPVGLDHEDQYKVIITLAGGGRVVSNILVLTVVRPTLTFEKNLEEKATKNHGSSHQMRVIVKTEEVTEGAEELEYRWFKDGDPIESDNDNGITINKNTLTINSVHVNNHPGKYKVVVTVIGGRTATSNTQTLTVPSPISPVKVNIKESVEERLSNNVFIVKAGNKYTFSTNVTGVSYQWFRNDNPIPGATERRYIINSFNSNHVGKYHLTVTLNSDTTIKRSSVKADLRLE